VDASASYIHGRFGDFYAIDSRLYAAPYPPCNLSYGPATAECSNLTGHTLPNSPTWTANAGIQYTYHVAANQTFTPRLDYAFVASQWATVFANSSFADSLDSRTLFNVLLSYDIGKLDIAAFATNFTNRQYVAAQSVGTPVPVQLIPGVPRLYGIRAMLRF
jgi:iron complex outermembrane receptor protein